jgi:2-C-methyl-D-erythritol 2,4-cyclodiphosphate synthase
MPDESTGPGMRVGTGFDVHRLVKGRKLILGGVEIRHETGLLGHSDADVLTHAVMSSILGAMAAGSLGDHFPDTDPAYKDIRSIDLLERVRIMMEEGGYSLANLDTMVVCDKPRLSPHVEKIRMNLADALRVPIERVSVKATGTEGLGFTGTGKGIAAQAVCLLMCPVDQDEDDQRERKRKKSARKPPEPPPPLPKIKPGRVKGCIVNVDGATDGNPGPSGIGIVFKTSKGAVLGKLSESIGQATSNEAEYTAAIRAAEICMKWGIKDLTLRTDSQLVAKQVNGEFQVANERILKLYRELMGLLKGFKKWKIIQIGREENTEADKLSRLALKK